MSMQQHTSSESARRGIDRRCRRRSGGRSSRGLTLMDFSFDQLRAAAHLRGVRPQVRTPDALQLAAAVGARCTALVSNDRRMPSLPRLPVLQLSDYV